MNINAFYSVTYNFTLCGEFNLLQLQQTLNSHRCIAGGRLHKHSSDMNRVFEYSFETEAGIAVVHVFAFDDNRPDCANKILFKIPVATPPQFISSVIEFLAELTDLSTFSIKAYEIRSGEGFSLGWHAVDDVIRLKQEYQEVHKAWREWAGMPACKTTEMLLPRDCIHTQVRKKQRPIKIFLCPRGSEINFYQLGAERSLILKPKKQIGALAAQGEAVEAKKSPSKPVSTQ